jgi:hypothetical protein
VNGSFPRTSHLHGVSYEWGLPAGWCSDFVAHAVSLVCLKRIGKELKKFVSCLKDFVVNEM